MQAIQTDKAPKAIGPYSQAIAVDNLVFTSGQIPIDPATGELIKADSIAQHAERVMQNLMAVLEAAGSSIDKVIKSTIFLNDLQEFPTVNEVYGKYFEGKTLPARSTFQVAALPKGARIEIEMIARR